MDSIKVIKKLGNGVMGTTYLIAIGAKKYICKIEKIWEADTLFRIDAPLWREILFADFCKKFPNHFMKLKSYEIIDECKHKQSLPGWKMDTYSTENWKLRNKSPYCSKLIYEPVLDGTLRTVLDRSNLKLPQLASIISQIIYAVGLMITCGFLHRDLHCNNIMYKKTTKKTIELGNTTVKTYGLQWYIIDYGMILHPNFVKPDMHKKQRRNELGILKNPHYDLAIFIFQTIDMPVWQMIEKNNLFDKIPTEMQLISKIKKTPEFKTILKYIPSLNNEPVVYNLCIMILYLLHYPAKYHELMGFNDSKYKKWILNYDDKKVMYSNIIKRLAKPNLIIKYLNTIVS